MADPQSAKFKVQLECGSNLVLSSVPPGPIEIVALPTPAQPSPQNPSHPPVSEPSKPGEPVKRPVPVAPRPTTNAQFQLIAPLDDAEAINNIDPSQFPSGSQVEITTTLEELEMAGDTDLGGTPLRSFPQDSTVEIVTPPLELDDLEQINLDQIPRGCTLLIGAEVSTTNPDELLSSLAETIEKHNLYDKDTNVEVQFFRNVDV